MSHLTQDIHRSGLIERGQSPSIFRIAILAILMLAGCSGGGGSGGAGSTGNSVPLNQPLTPVVRVYSAQEVRLSWIDNADNEDGYIVEKSLDNITFTEIGRVGQNTVTYSDISTANNQMLFYRVATYQGSNRSSYSDTVHAFQFFFDACVSSQVAQNTSIGKLYPLIVSGLNYSSDHHSSVTDTNSSFGFDANANTLFSIGYIPISRISAKALTSTTDLVAGVTLGTSSATNVEMNILRLLLALDGDSNSSNGIQLPCNLSTAYGDIDFTLDETAFANQADVMRLLNGKLLPTQAQALTEFQNARNKYYSGNYAVYYTELLSGMFPVAVGHIYFTINVDGTVTVTEFVDDSSSHHLTTASFLPDSAQNLYFTATRSDVLYSDLKITANIAPSYAVTGKFELNGVLKVSDAISGVKY